MPARRIPPIKGTFRQYEQALMANDTATLSELFADNPDDIPVVRSDSAGMLVGHNAITAFRAKRGGAPERKLHRRVARQLDANNACVISEFDKASGGRVIQTQVWSRVSDESNNQLDSRGTEPAWKIVAAHLTYPAPAVDRRVWRVVGTPPNPRAPGRISGGSSSGPAAAVACGQATIGLGTDTAGSIRIPASYQGLWGIRTTHGRISRKSIHPLSESFDTVGWMTRDAQTLAFVAKAMMLERKSNTMIDGLEICPALDQCVKQDVREPFIAFRASIGNRNSGAHGDISTAGFTSGMLDGLVSIFQIVRGYEAWQANGEWVSQHWSSLAAEIAARFRQSPTASDVHGAADFLIFQQNPYCYATRNNSTGFLCYCYT